MKAPDLHILIIDDEPEIRTLLRTVLENNQFKVACASSGKEGLKFIHAKTPDAILLDLGLPDIDGQNVLLSIREVSNVPVIILSARAQEDEKVKALDHGADDYLTKPFGTAELLARLKVSLRHAQRLSGTLESVYAYKDLKVDLEKRLVSMRDKPIQLTPTEYKLLAALTRHPGKVMTQSHLINEVWGKNSQGNSHYLRIYVQHLRNKIDDDPADPVYILTDPGIGYRLATI